MQKVYAILAFLLVITGVPACHPNDRTYIPHLCGQAGESTNPGDGDHPGEPENKENMRITLKIGTAIFTATLADNATAEAFRSRLPLTVTMPDLNRNEKYHTLSESLPTAAENPDRIRQGDIMLYGSSTIVLFYKTFETSYPYTRIGTVDNPSGLPKALGGGNVTVHFERAK